MKNKNLFTKKNIKIFLLMTALFAVLIFGAYFLSKLIGDSRIFHDLQTSALTMRLKKNGAERTFAKRLLVQMRPTEEKEEIRENCFYPKVENAEYKGEFLENEMKLYAEEGEEFSVQIYMKNTGNVPWFGDESVCSPIVRLGTAREQDRKSALAYLTNKKETGWLQGNRIRMVESRVNPGEVATFRFVTRAPWDVDTYREYFQPLVEGKMWMTRKEETARVDIAVGNTDERDSDRLTYINKSLPASTIDLDRPKEVHVDISDQKLHVKIGDVLVREYVVSTGTFRTPTPLGKFKLLSKQDLRIGAAKPHYRMPKFQMFTKQGAGFHALPYLANDKGVFWNEALNHIGRPVSHGCVRLLPEDADDLFALTAVGDEIVITR